MHFNLIPPSLHPAALSRPLPQCDQKAVEVGGSALSLPAFWEPPARQWRSTLVALCPSAQGSRFDPPCGLRDRQLC